MARSVARRCDSGSAASSGSSLRASMRTPWRRRSGRRLHHDRRGELVRSNPPQRLGSHLLFPPHLDLGQLAPSAGEASGRHPAERPVAEREHLAVVWRADRRASAIAPSISASARRDRSSNSDPAGVSSTRRVVRTNSTTPRSRSSSRIARDKRRLRHMQTLRGATEMQLLRYCDEVAQLPQLDRSVHEAGY